MPSSETPETTSKKRWTAAELRKMPAAERDAVMEAAAALMEAEYPNNPELTAFEAFGEIGNRTTAKLLGL
jgi:hypothetical protein